MKVVTKNIYSNRFPIAMSYAIKEALVERHGLFSPETDGWVVYEMARYDLDDFEWDHERDGHVFRYGDRKEIEFRDIKSLEKWEELVRKVKKYEENIKKHPIYDDLISNPPKGLEIPEFLKQDNSTVTAKPSEFAVKGWYQNSRGTLFHYDGILWDRVPEEKIWELEFLGNG